MLNKVNNFLCQRQMIRQFFRYIHCEPSSKILYPLQNRKLLHISGNEASVFLQGLITNDMKHFEDNAKSIYAMFLNNKGRVLYDTLIHKWEGEGSFMIECDKNIHIILQKHLKLYKLKRRVDIKDVQDDYKLWALIAPMQSISESIGDAKPNINIYKDPRLTDLGFRILSKANLEGSEIAGYIAKDITVETSDEGYRYLRYKLGVSEGCDDLPPGSSFPLEANCDYLHGVSFHKGCYIGQELTARVHHTGVVRKRIMPIKFTEPIMENLEKDTVISSVENKKLNIGKLKSYVKDYGLGLVRIKEALDSGLQIGSKHAAAMRPSWWPVEAPKEKASSLKSEYEMQEKSKTDEKGKESEHIVINFKCVSCSLCEKVHYKGKNPPFSRNIELKYTSYIMKDPFSPPGKGEILVLGADCSICERSVCIGKNCSLFYSKLYCLDCVKINMDKFPAEIRSKVQIKSKK